MGNLQAIENALVSINDSVFQELCDSFLILRNENYSAFSRIGSQNGKQKTRKGTPDSLIKLPNGKYIFVECSTNKSSGVNKLKEDIQKCIDSSKTGIQLEKISEIIICINFELNVKEIEILNCLLNNLNIVLTIYDIRFLADVIGLKYKNLARQYLDLPFDTGQVVSIEQFIHEYQRASQSLATPLDNTFLHRKEEIAQLMEMLLDSDFVIITGQPGIGKTKLAIETINMYLNEDNTFQSYCISYKQHVLLEDLFQYLNTDKNYILFIDDANRIDIFGQITGFYKVPRQGKLKILLTVRDYSFKDIWKICHEFNPKHLEISKLTDEQIIDIISAEPFKILNYRYNREIIRIADGNPRLAIMTANLALKEQNIYALYDVSDLFDKYFSTFINDKDELSNENNIKTLGIIAFFHTIPFKNIKLTAEILDKFEIRYSDFINSIEILEKLEIVEIQYEHVRIPEQNLSIFFFYKTFIKDNLLTFSILLEYFDNNQYRFKDCIIPAYNTFDSQKVKETIIPALQNYWKKININEGIAFNFISIFWFFLNTETLNFIYRIVNQMTIVSKPDFRVIYDTNEFVNNPNNIIELLGNYYRYPSTDFKNALELSFEFIRKEPKYLPELIQKIRERLLFDEDDEHSNFFRQINLFTVIINGLVIEDKLSTTIFYELCKNFLSFTFTHTKSERNNIFKWYDYQLPEIKEIFEFRRKIWELVDSQFHKNPKQSLELLNNYSKMRLKNKSDILNYDCDFIIEIIENHLIPDVFEHCIYVQTQIQMWEENSIKGKHLLLMSEKYQNSTFRIYQIITKEYDLKIKKAQSLTFRDLKELKETAIRNSFLFGSKNEIDSFYNNYSLIKPFINNDWNFQNILDIIIDENFKKNFDIGFQILNKIIENNNELSFTPNLVFKNLLNNRINTQYIWNLIENNSFQLKFQWMMAFFINLDETLITYNETEKIIESFKILQDSVVIYLIYYQKYLVLNPNLYETILEIINAKNNIATIQIRTWINDDESLIQYFGNNFEIIMKWYSQQMLLDSSFDYKKEILLYILKIDSNFLVELIRNLISINKSDLLHLNEISNEIWKLNEIEYLTEKIIEVTIENEPYFWIGENVCNSLFFGLKDESKFRAEKFLYNYTQKYFHDFNKMSIVADIVRNTMKYLFKSLLLLHLSLNTDVELFQLIRWKRSGGIYSGNVIIGDIDATEWRGILSIVEKSEIGIKLLPIINFINEQISTSLETADWERLNRFLEKKY